MKKTVTLLLFFLCFTSAVPQTPVDSLITFKIKDQFNREYTGKSFKEDLLIIFGGDREGHKFIPVWRTAIADSLKKNIAGTIKFIGLADLCGVPFFMKGFVRGKFPKEKTNWLLMDWKGKFSKTYHFKKKHCNILIFNRARKLVYQTAVRELDTKQLNLIIKKIHHESSTKNAPNH